MSILRADAAISNSLDVGSVELSALAPILERVDRTHCWSKARGAKNTPHHKFELTDARVRLHLQGSIGYGACPIRRGESTTRLALLDFDSHGGETSWDQMQAVAARVSTELERRGLRPLPFRSSGGRGIHLISLWDEPQDARSVRTLLVDALRACNLRNGAGGVAKGQVEIFPKQDSVPADGYGSMFILPLAFASVPLDDLALAPLPRSTAIEWPMSQPVPFIEAPVRESVSAEPSGNLKRCAELLAQLPEDFWSRPDHDTWFFSVVAPVHHECSGSKEGFELVDFHSSKGGDAYKGREHVETRYYSLGKREGPVRTIATLEALVREQPASADDFDTLPVEAPAAAGPPAPDPYTTKIDRTDTGNANLLIKIAKGSIQYVPETKNWLWWDGGRWLVDDYGTFLNNHALKVAKYYSTQARKVSERVAAVSDAAEGKHLTKRSTQLKEWAMRCRNRQALINMLECAAKAEGVPLAHTNLDRNPWLLGVENGAVDLRSGQLLAAEAREEYVTKRCPVRFDPAAQAPRWVQFVDEITGTPLPGSVEQYTRRPDLADYLQRMLGYCLTGSTSEHKLFIAIGAGANGKNVLLETIAKLMGSYAVTLSAEALMATKYASDPERPTPMARSLAGARFALASESKDTHRLDVGTVKNHTGDSRMTARGMRENAFTFDISHKLCLMTNHRPALDHLDAAIRGRLHLIPFDRQWNRPGDTERDPRLPDGDKDLMRKFSAEAEGILAWLIQGAVRYSADGLVPPSDVVSLTRNYFREQDHFGRWLGGYERCAPKSGTLASTLFQAFEWWCMAEELTSREPATTTAFGRALANRGIESLHTEHGRRYGLQVLGSELA